MTKKKITAWMRGVLARSGICKGIKKAPPDNMSHGAVPSKFACTANVKKVSIQDTKFPFKVNALRKAEDLWAKLSTIARTVCGMRRAFDLVTAAVAIVCIARGGLLLSEFSTDDALISGYLVGAPVDVAMSLRRFAFFRPIRNPIAVFGLFAAAVLPMVWLSQPDPSMDFLRVVQINHVAVLGMAWAKKLLSVMARFFSK